MLAREVLAMEPQCWAVQPARYPLIFRGSVTILLLHGGRVGKGMHIYGCQAVLAGLPELVCSFCLTLLSWKEGLCYGHGWEISMVRLCLPGSYCRLMMVDWLLCFLGSRARHILAKGSCRCKDCSGSKVVPVEARYVISGTDGDVMLAGVLVLFMVQPLAVATP